MRYRVAACINVIKMVARPANECISIYKLTSPSVIREPVDIDIRQSGSPHLPLRLQIRAQKIPNKCAKKQATYFFPSSENLQTSRFLSSPLPPGHLAKKCVKNKIKNVQKTCKKTHHLVIQLQSSKILYHFFVQPPCRINVTLL